MSIGGTVIKFDVCPSNNDVYKMSLRLVHKRNIEGLGNNSVDFCRLTIEGKNRCHLVSWKHVCKSRSKGGLGIQNLTKFNISFMSKWWLMLEKDKGPWKDFMWRKYLSNSCSF
jgi:hypothetical protein